MRCSVFIATSLDGYIARTNGSIDWLMKANTLAPPGEDCGYKTFINSVDLLIMGKRSYDAVCEFESWPYDNLPVVVMSRSGVSISSDLADTVTQSSETPLELYERLRHEGFKHLYIDGGALIQSFLAEELIDELTITTAPTLIGEGISLFGKHEDDLSLTLLEFKGYDFGFIQSKYKIMKRDHCGKRS